MVVTRSRRMVVASGACFEERPTCRRESSDMIGTSQRSHLGRDDIHATDWPSASCDHCYRSGCISRSSSCSHEPNHGDRHTQQRHPSISGFPLRAFRTAGVGSLVWLRPSWLVFQVSAFSPSGPRCSFGASRQWAHGCDAHERIASVGPSPSHAQGAFDRRYQSSRRSRSRNSHPSSRAYRTNKRNGRAAI